MFCFNYNCGKDVRKIDVGFSLNNTEENKKERKIEPKIIYLQLKLNITQQKMMSINS